MRRWQAFTGKVTPVLEAEKRTFNGNSRFQADDFGLGRPRYHIITSTFKPGLIMRGRKPKPTILHKLEGTSNVTDHRNRVLEPVAPVTFITSHLVG